jgi:hypothetical protein
VDGYKDMASDNILEQYNSNEVAYKQNPYLKHTGMILLFHNTIDRITAEEYQVRTVQEMSTKTRNHMLGSGKN